MTAMDNATRNAGEMIKQQLRMNRTRQAMITEADRNHLRGGGALSS